jgi:expansin (peptidoglycan-binding protein)
MEITVSTFKSLNIGSEGMVIAGDDSGTLMQAKLPLNSPVRKWLAESFNSEYFVQPDSSRWWFAYRVVHNSYPETR